MIFNGHWFQGKISSCFLYLLMHSLTILVVQEYELITCVQQGNENAGNLISVVQFLINKQLEREREREREQGWCGG